VPTAAVIDSQTVRAADIVPPAAGTTAGRRSRAASGPANKRMQVEFPDAELQLLRADHAQALLGFETENRAYFAASIPDRGDDYFANFYAWHR
jgi:hypothetical protein